MKSETEDYHLDVAFFLFSGNRIGKKSCRINTVSFWREKSRSIAENKNIDEVKAMSYSCSESQPGADRVPMGFSALPFQIQFLSGQSNSSSNRDCPASVPFWGKRLPILKGYFFPDPPSDTARKLSRNRPRHHII